MIQQNSSVANGNVVVTLINNSLSQLRSGEIDLFQASLKQARQLLRNGVEASGDNFVYAFSYALAQKALLDIRSGKIDLGFKIAMRSIHMSSKNNLPVNKESFWDILKALKAHTPGSQKIRKMISDVRLKAEVFGERGPSAGHNGILEGSRVFQLLAS
jgi:hypothetical protein